MAKVTTYVLKKISGGKEEIERTIARDYGVRTSQVSMHVGFTYGGEASIDFFVPNYYHSVCFMTSKGEIKFIPKASYNAYYGKVEEVVETESDEQKMLKDLTEEVKRLRKELEDNKTKAVKETAITKK